MLLARSTSSATVPLAALALAHSTPGRLLGVNIKGHFGPGSSGSLRIDPRDFLVDRCLLFNSLLISTSSIVPDRVVDTWLDVPLAIRGMRLCLTLASEKQHVFHGFEHLA